MKKKIAILMIVLTLFVFPLQSKLTLGQSQSSGGQVLGVREIIPLLFSAIGQFDALLMANGGLISGTLLNDQFTIHTENDTHVVDRSEVDTLDLAHEGQALDNILLETGETLQGQLELEQDGFAIRLATGEEMRVPQSDLRGAILQIPLDQEGVLSPFIGELPEEIKKLVNNPLLDEMVFSLSLFDWMLLNNKGIISGFALEESFSFSGEGLQLSVTRDDLSVMLFLPGADLIVMSATGKFLVGALDLTELHFQPAVPNAQPMSLDREQIRGVLFRVSAGTFGGGGGPQPGS